MQKIMILPFDLYNSHRALLCAQENPTKPISYTHYVKNIDSQKNIRKMAFTEAQKARIVDKYIRTQSVTVVQR